MSRKTQVDTKFFAAFQVSLLNASVQYVNGACCLHCRSTNMAALRSIRLQWPSTQVPKWPDFLSVPCGNTLERRRS